MKKDFLLEIGCENLPSGYIEGALKQLEEMFGRGLKTERIDFDRLYLTGTPNRLVVKVEGIAEKQQPAVEQITGPPVSVAVSPEGGFTKAALGFAAKQGVGEKDLKRITTEKGEYLAVVRKIGGGTTRSIMIDQVPGWIMGIRFPKVMKWGDEQLRFARPVRWIMCFLGDSPLPLKVGSLRSVQATRLSPYSLEMTEVKGIREYFKLIKDSGKILDYGDRREKVAAMARKAAEQAGGRLVEDEGLFSMVANLLESPVVMHGVFDKSFLKLPREVIVTALKSHQRYFSIEDGRGALKSGFIAFADGARKNSKEILKGYERVLQARLEDARFYYREDTARPIAEMAAKLSGIVWLEGLGDLSQKSERIGRLSEWLCSKSCRKPVELSSLLKRAAELAKADLASEMVKDGKEFTLLQGYIGREYAKASGERKEVSDAIFEHYFPRFSGDSLPESEAGLLLSIADRLDTITGCFIQGLEPTGSQDPYALRRHAISILRMMIERRLPVSLPEAVEKSLDLFGSEGLLENGSHRESLFSGIMALLTQRFNNMLRTMEYDHDLVSAILSAPWGVPFAAAEMTAALQEMRNSGALGDFVLAMKRIANIIPAARKPALADGSCSKALAALAEEDESALGFSSSLFAEEIESRFRDAAFSAARRLVSIEKPEKLREAFTIIAGIIPAINGYFDAVLVNCDDEKVRDNRLAFLAGLYCAFGYYCDYSLIAGEQA